MYAKVDTEIADQSKRRRAHPTAPGGTFKDADRRLCALFSSSHERSGRVTTNVLLLDVRSARYVPIAYLLARSDLQFGTPGSVVVLELFTFGSGVW